MTIHVITAEVSSKEHGDRSVPIMSFTSMTKANICLLKCNEAAGTLSATLRRLGDKWAVDPVTLSHRSNDALGVFAGSIDTASAGALRASICDLLSLPFSRLREVRSFDLYTVGIQ